MRKLVRVCFSAILMLTLCACSAPDTPIESTNASTISSGQTINQNDVEETTLPTVTEVSVPSIRATDYLETVHYISNELANQAYLVCGTDYSENICYGLLYASGHFEPLTEYGAYYPLADGNFFVTDDENVIRNFEYTDWDTQRKPMCNSGKILDRTGKILYEPDPTGPYQKMYVINSNTIFVLAASSGFDGIDVYWGVLNNEGKWIHELDNTGLLVETIKANNLIEMNSDGSWSYTATKKKLIGYTEDREKIYDYKAFCSLKCGPYDDKENNSLCFFLGTIDDTDNQTIKKEIIIYQASSNSFAAHFDYSLAELLRFEQVSENLWSHWSAYNSNYTSDTLYDSTGKIGSIKNYLFTLNGVKYWQGGNLTARDGILYSDEYPDGIYYPENIAARITRFIMVKDGKVYMALEGADGLSYLAVGDLHGNIITEPYRPTNFNKNIRATGNNGFAACKEDDTLYIINLLDPTAEAQVIYIGDMYVDKVRFLGNGLIAVTDCHDKGDETLIYTIQGDRIA